MSKLTTRLHSHPTARRLPAHMVEAPALLDAVSALEPRILGRLIHHVGLEDAGELVALATVDQIARILDDDL